jgi:putative pyruvate formate lyase activating enzyme
VSSASDQCRLHLVDALRHDTSCLLCEHRCATNRAAGERGRCKADATARVFRHRVEYGDELELIPSHLFYLSGCDLRCVFCIAELDAFDPSRGRELTGDFFNAAVAWGKGQGAKNIQWVGGEPTIHLPRILEVMADCPALPPVVWKSDFHMTPDALRMLDGVVSTYVADFKFGNDRCAKELSGVEHYVEIIQRNLMAAARQDARLIVRHLLLPGHESCCYEPVARWMQQHLPQAAFSLRDSYLPSWRARKIAGLDTPLSVTAGVAAREYAKRIGLAVIQ